MRQLIKAIPKDGGSRTALSQDWSSNATKNRTGSTTSWSYAMGRRCAHYHQRLHQPLEGRFLHPTEDRAITLREAALLQSFPHGYVFSLRRGKVRRRRG